MHVNRGVASTSPPNSAVIGMLPCWPACEAVGHSARMRSTAPVACEHEGEKFNRNIMRGEAHIGGGGSAQGADRAER
jgi:hypothetical protein